MEYLKLQHHHHRLPPFLPPNYMNPFAVSSKLKPEKLLASLQSRLLCATSLNLSSAHELTRALTKKYGVPSDGYRPRVSVCATQLKENWLASLSCPFPRELDQPGTKEYEPSRGIGSEWVIGVDPDVSGALALLKGDRLGCSAQIFDAPHLKVMVGKRTRRRLDAKSIVQLVQGFEAPVGTVAYIEQSIPFPQDGKQGWWSGGFNYGLWIGVLVASGFSVVPVPSMVWKNSLELAGSCTSKDDSRKLASELFPSLSPMLKRKKDHGRAEALLIAVYGKSATKKVDESTVSRKLASESVQCSYLRHEQEMNGAAC
ncbi:hypothetical protein Dimus_011797 [Dionaea muscipula]